MFRLFALAFLLLASPVFSQQLSDFADKLAPHEEGPGGVVAIIENGEIVELAGPAYSGKPAKFDVVVVDRDGKELARTVYEVKAKS